MEQSYILISIFLQQAAHREPEIVTITLNKPLNSGMGVSIVAAKVTASVLPKCFFLILMHSLTGTIQITFC